MMNDLAKATDELADNFAMICERQPAMRPILAARAKELAEHVEGLFQPFFDLADGKITQEEFTAIHEERDRKEQERRRAHYESVTTMDGIVHVICEHCGTRHDWVLEEHEGQWPATYFECVDIEGAPCDESMDDEPDDDDEEVG